MRVKGYAFSFCVFAILICQLTKVANHNKMPTAHYSNTFYSNIPLSQAHAHNDYQHPQPLLDALNHGFTSIEVDVYLRKGDLYVAHDRPFFLDPNRTLTKLYLEPLLKRYQETGGNFFKNSNQPISLMIDIKNRKHQTYEVLKRIIEPFQEMLTSWEDNEACTKGVNIVLSGKRPIYKVLTETKRWVQIDGRLCDLGKHYDPEFMPVISGHYDDVCNASLLFRQCAKIKLENIGSIAKKVSAEGKKLRIWKTPENPKTWNALLDKGVDIINSDSLQLLSNFLTERKGESPLYSLEGE